jgi:serine/threonine protein kinase
VKVLQAATALELDELQRFLREARAIAAVKHPAVVRTLHVDVSADGRFFQIMELVVGEALAAAHAAGVVHCDVKPLNVMLTGDPPGLKLLDFGVSKLREAWAFGAHTGLIVMGTRVARVREMFMRTSAFEYARGQSPWRSVTTTNGRSSARPSLPHRRWFARR